MNRNGGPALAARTVPTLRACVHRFAANGQHDLTESTVVDVYMQLRLKRPRLNGLDCAFEHFRRSGRNLERGLALRTEAAIQTSTLG